MTKKSTLGLFMYFVISLNLMEIGLKIFIFHKPFTVGILFTTLFTITISLVMYSFCSLFSERVNRRLSITFMIAFGILFSSQLVYYKCFNTFYILYSVANASQIMDFWKDILVLIAKNIPLIAWFFVPPLVLIKYGDKILSDKSPSIKKKIPLIPVLLAVLFHIISLGALYTGGTEPLGPFNLYLTRSFSNLSVEKLGLLTSMRLDLTRLVGGNSTVPVLTPPIVSDDQEEVEKVPTKVVEYNTMDIDFSSLIATEEDEVIENMHKYFNSIKPTEKNEYTGMYQGYNLIFITAEAFSPYGVRSDVTPTLYKLVNEGFNFTNFYNPIWEVSTLDGEYANCTGLLPKSGVWSFHDSHSNYLPFVMGNQLKKLNYKTMAYHNHTYNYYHRDLSHTNMGYEYKGLGNGLKVKKVWPASDLEMIEKSVDEYINHQPFHTYYMTVSGHLRYSFLGNTMAKKNKALVDHLSYSEEAKAYIATQIELDRGLEYLLNRLRDAKVLDRTLIVLNSDHYPYGLSTEAMNELAGHEVERNFELYKNNLIIYSEGMNPKTIDKPCSSIDIIPTVSNLLGLEYDSRLLSGKDIFSSAEPLVMFLNRSFITDKGSYNSQTNTFTPNKSLKVSKDYISKMSETIEASFYYSARILDKDYYNIVLPH